MEIPPDSVVDDILQKVYEWRQARLECIECLRNPDNNCRALVTRLGNAEHLLTKVAKVLKGTE